MLPIYLKRAIQLVIGFFRFMILAVVDKQFLCLTVISMWSPMQNFPRNSSQKNAAGAGLINDLVHKLIQSLGR